MPTVGQSRAAMRSRGPTDQSPGPAVDAGGRQVIDPTENVKAVLAAAVERIDDIVIATVKRLDDQMLAMAKRLDDQLAMSIKGVEEKATLRTGYEEKIRLLQADMFMALSSKESDRIDAIRENDSKAVAIAANEARAQATVLADALSRNAEMLRSLVATTAAATAQQLTQTITPIQDRITVLERGFNLGEGRARVSEPQLDDIRLELAKLSAARSASEGKGAGRDSLWGYFVAGVGVIVAVISAFVAIAGRGGV